MSQQQLFRKVYDVLLKGKDNGSGGNKVPTGAMPSVWMTHFPVPKNHFDEVYSNIILGDYYLSKNKEKLQELGVTHLVNCAQGTKYNQIDTSQEFFEDAGIQFHGIKALDVMTFKICNHFHEAADFIDKALKAGGKVYVHCQSGVSRSASIVLSYLMLKQGMDVLTAVNTVVARREIIPNEGFLRQLCQFSVELYGEDQVQPVQGIS